MNTDAIKIKIGDYFGFEGIKIVQTKNYSKQIVIEKNIDETTIYIGDY